MGNKLDKPVTEKHNEQGTGNGLRYGIANMQGWLNKQENAHCATIGVNEKLKDWCFFAVFDGHHKIEDSKRFGKDSKISTYCAEHLLESIMDTDESSDFADRIRSGFLNLDQSMRTISEIDGKENGTTAVCTFVSPERIYVANCGNSKAELCNSGKLILSTEVHSPENKKEYERIKRAHGHCRDNLVNEQLAPTRCLGVYKWKEKKYRDQCELLVSPEPEVSVVARDDKDEFLVIACDGIWNCMENMQKGRVWKFIRSRLLVTDDLVTIANELLDTCLEEYSESNMSVVLVTFPGAPTPSPEAIEKEKNLERDIESLIIKLISIPPTVRTASRESVGISVPNLMRTLRDMKTDLPNLPPEGNVGTKRGFIESIFQRCVDRGNMLKMFVDEAVDVLLQKNDDDNRSLIELMMDKRKENISPRLPSGDDNTMRSPNTIASQTKSTTKRKDLFDNEPPAKKKL